MATSYTSLLGFALPVTGELQGTWGDTVNNSITQLCEDSIAGVATASVLSSDWTLTTTGAGAANQARMAILIPTGSPGVSRNIIAPSKSKTYTVINQSNAAVVVKGAATTGVSVASGDTVVVAWNGSDFVAVKNADGTFTNLTYTGTLTGSTGVINIGSGQLYKDASGNVGIGTSFPTTKLAVVGNIGAMSGGKIYLWDSTNNYTPYIQSPAADVLSFFGNSGSERMRIDSSGNVGIGTSSPGAKLTIAGGTLPAPGFGNIGMSSQLTTGQTGTFDTGTLGSISNNLDASSLELSVGSTSGYETGISLTGKYATNYQGAIRFLTASTERMRIDSSGNVGIGTNSPSASAILDAQSTSKGVRFPNMTTTQKNAIASPSAGLVVFDTTLAKLCVYSGSAWQTITSV